MSLKCRGIPRGVSRDSGNPLLKMGLASYYVKDSEIAVYTIANH